MQLQEISTRCLPLLTTEVSELKNLMKTMIIDKQKAQAPASVKAVEQSCVTCGGAHSYKNCPATDGMYIRNIARVPFYKFLAQESPILIKGIPNPSLDLRWFQTKSDLLVFLRFKTIKTVSIQIKEIISTKIEEPVSIKTVEITSIKGKFTNLQLFNHQFIKLLLNKMQGFFKDRFREFKSKANDAVIKEYQNQAKVYKNQMTSFNRNAFKVQNFNTTRLPNSELYQVQNLPEKLEDPRKFLIPCALQELDRTNALANSGASINLLPHSIYKQLGLGALTPTRMTLELANRSITHPMGIAEDVVVRVDGFTFLADFVGLNLEPDPELPIIFRRPFRSQPAKALIDLYAGKITLRVETRRTCLFMLKIEKSKNNEKYCSCYFCH
ncbi:reverse transcriptase domain-containing protein [Tanacetum coccineum]